MNRLAGCVENDPTNNKDGLTALKFQIKENFGLSIYLSHCITFSHRKLTIENIAFSLNARHFKMISQCAKIQLQTYRFDDVICNFTLFADDVRPQQDAK